jgi:hypothetical protein
MRGCPDGTIAGDRYDAHLDHEIRGTYRACDGSPVQTGRPVRRGGFDTGFFSYYITSDDDIRPDVEVVKDIRHIEVDDLRGFHCIVHLAALSNDPMASSRPL